MNSKPPINSYAIMWFVFSILCAIFYWSPFPYLFGYGPILIINYVSSLFSSFSPIVVFFLLLYIFVFFAPFALIARGVYKTRRRIQINGERGVQLIFISYILLGTMLLGMAYFILLSLSTLLAS